MIKCPVCNETIINGSMCPNCGIDAVIFNKTWNASIKLYNKGLIQAKHLDLSGAICSLRQSVKLSKRNYMARNLLGLCYYETGRIGEALKEWILSASYKHEDNFATTYIDFVQKTPRNLEKINDSIRMYNQARKYLIQNSGDLAVIQLKKAIDLNEKFVEAYNLLTLCYIIEDDYSGARSCIDSVLSIDRYNSKALNYAENINYNRVSTPLRRSSSRPKQNNTAPQKSNDSMTSKREVFTYPQIGRPVIGRGEIISFFIGIVCTAAVLMTLVIPAWVDEKNAKINELNQQIQSSQSTSPDSQTEQLQNEIAELRKTLSKYEEEAEYNDAVQKIQHAEERFAEGDFEAVAIAIADIRPEILTDDILSKYNSLKENSYSRASESLYNTGKSQFLNGEYELANSSFENCMKFSAGGENYLDDILYYLGKIAENNGDNEKAKSYYQQLMTEHPNSNQYLNAENSYKSLTE